MNFFFSNKIKKSLIAFTAFTSLFISSAKADQIDVQELIKTEESNSSAPKLLEDSSPICRVTENDAQYLSRIQKLAYTLPMTLINNGEAIKLIDESIWSIYPSQCRSVQKWLQEDVIFIKPNIAWFSKDEYPFVLYNYRTQEAIKAAFHSMPAHFQRYRQKIVKKVSNHAEGIYFVQLDDEDATVWQINPNDANFDYWEEGDSIIVGVNNYWRVNNYPQILINDSIVGAPYCEALFKGYGI